MNNAEYTKIIELYETHLQVKKLANKGTIRLYLFSVNEFFKFCKKFHKELVLPENWSLENLGVRELEAFLKNQMDILHWQRSTIVTCVSALKSFMNFLAEIEHLKNNPIQYFKIPRDLSVIGNQRFDISQIEALFKNTRHNSLIEMQQSILLELIYGLGMKLSKITEIKRIIPELDEGTVRIYFKNSRFNDYPFNKLSIKILKIYLKKIDYIEGEKTFWINQKGRTMSAVQLQNLLNKFFVKNNFPTISANELRDLSVKHFAQRGADIRSMQTLRKSKQIRRLQSLNESDFDHLKNIIKNKHIRNENDGEDKLN